MVSGYNVILYSAKQIVRYIIALLALTVVMKITDGAGFIVLIPIALCSLSDRNIDRLLFVVLLSLTTLVINSHVMPKDMVYAISQRGMMVLLGVIMVCKVFGIRQAGIIRPFLWMVPYLFLMCITSATGWSPIISYLKLTLFSISFIGLYAITNRAMLVGINPIKMRSMFLAVVIFFVFGSIAVMPFPSISNLTQAELLQSGAGVSLFRGITTHSQTIGPLMAFFGIVLVADLVFSIQRMDKLYLMLLLCILVLIIKSSSRTGLGALGIGGCFLASYAIRAKMLRARWRTSVMNWIIAISLLTPLIIILFPSTRDMIARFVIKYQDVDDSVEVTTENVLLTRQGKLDSALENWKGSPLMGNGFQVSENMIGFTARDIRDVLSAPVEKSTWVTAILEEGGVCGELLFILFVLITVSTLSRMCAYIGLSAFITLLIINLGEFTIFSISGTGGVYWLLVFVALIFDNQRLAEQRSARQIYQVV